MPWTESSSAHFEARHEASDERGAAAVLELLETHAASRSRRVFPRIPEEVAVVMHAGTRCALARGAAAAARLGRERRDLAALPRGLVRRRARCTCSPRAALERRASAVPDSRDMLMLTPAALYAQLVVATNNRRLPPPLRPSPPALGVARVGRGRALLGPDRVRAPGDRAAPARGPGRRASRPRCATPRCSAARSSTCSSASAARRPPSASPSPAPRARRRARSSTPSPGAS